MIQEQDRNTDRFIWGCDACSQGQRVYGHLPPKDPGTEPPPMSGNEIVQRQPTKHCGWETLY